MDELRAKLLACVKAALWVILGFCIAAAAYWLGHAHGVQEPATPPQRIQPAQPAVQVEYVQVFSTPRDSVT